MQECKLVTLKRESDSSGFQLNMLHVYTSCTHLLFYTVPLPSILLNLQGPEDQEVMTS